MVRHLTVPYVSYWSFGEQLPVLEEDVPSADQISFALETVAAVIAQQFDRTDVLADNRDAYVAAARSHQREFELDLLVSTPRGLLHTTMELAEELRALGLSAAWSVSGDPEFLDRSGEPAKHLCVVVDGTLSRWQTTEAEGFVRHTLGPDGDQRQLFCVLTRGTDRERLPGFLRNLRHLEVEPGVRPVRVARQLHELITATPADWVDPDDEALRGAASALRTLPPTMPYAGRFALVAETVRGMAVALDDGDMDLLADRTSDLALLGKAHGNGDRVTAPEDVRALVGALLDRIDRRITAFTD
jgi:hypothetical protein